MIEIVYRILKKEKDEFSDSGVAEKVYGKKSRKSTYDTWDCRDCGKSFFYSVVKCPLCSSGNVKEIRHAVSVQIQAR